MISKMKKYCIVLASGTGSRFGANVPKQFVKICGKMVIEHTLAACDCGVFDELFLVVSRPYLDKMRKMIAANGYSVRVRVVEGGASRKESCRRGIAEIPDRDAYVVIHNGVQPFVTSECFQRCLRGLGRHQAVTSGMPCVYTILKVDDHGVIVEMPERSHLYNDMGVECFRLSLLRKLFASYDDVVSTDIIGMVFRSGIAKVYVVEGDSRNIKITYPEDVVLARKLIKEMQDA